MPETLQTIEARAFSKCSNLKSVIAPGVTEINNSAFYLCSDLDNVYFPKLEKIKVMSFSHTGQLDGFPFEKLKQIPRSAFSHSQILKINLENAVSIESYAFGDCRQLIEAHLPKIDGERIDSGVFESCCMLETITINPECTDLAESFLRDCSFTKIDFFPNIESIGTKALAENDNLSYVSFPNVTSVADAVFQDDYNLIKVEIPKASDFGGYTFSGCESLTEIELSEDIEAFESLEFSGCTSLKNLKLYGDFTTYPDTFKDSSIERLEMNRITKLNSLPETKNCVIAMPSTFTQCSENTSGRNYVIYGTKGTYAEEWANENGHQFIEVSQKTAILNDLPMLYENAEDTLTADVIGFNKTYQWYGNSVADNTSGEKIENATDKEFKPSDYGAYKYYYCVITSTDMGCEPITIRTGITANRSSAADYTEYNKAVDKANSLDRSLYVDLTALDTALSVDVSGKNITEQSIVDEQTQAILAAIDNLVYKSADYTEYNKAVDKANSLDRSLYVDLTALDTALSVDVSGKNITEQSIVDEQTQAILAAIGSLVYKSADYTEYNKAVDKANSLDRSLYVDLTALDAALSVDVSKKNITEQSVVDEQTQAILAAIGSLVYKSADYTEYNKAVDKANSLDRSLYVDLTALDAALSVDVSKKNITEQSVVDEQTQAILAAINNLEYKPADYSKVDEAIKNIPSDLSGYTDDSVTALNELLKKAEEYKNADITKQSQVNELAAQIGSAVQALELKPVSSNEPDDNPTVPSTNPTEPTNDSINENTDIIKDDDAKSPDTGSDYYYSECSIALLVSFFILVAFKMKKLNEQKSDDL